MCCVCFFFKQKTAYEMRISDWSSDVCSSDLQRLAGLIGTHRRLDVDDGDPGVLQPRSEFAIDWRELSRPMIASKMLRIHARLRRHQRHDQLHALREIGRASCRERVCQYV